MATLSAQPSTPMSVYRPMRFVIDRNDPALNLIAEIFIADASDVSTIGNGLQIGDVVVRYTTTVNGPVSMAAGQTILLNEDCDDYAGVHMVTNFFTYSGSDYAVIESEDFGAHSGGYMRIWLNNLVVWLKLYVWTDPAADPHEVVLRGTPGSDALTSIDVGPPLRDYFTHRIDPLLTSGMGWNAHGVSAIFYRVTITVTYDLPGVTDPPDPWDYDTWRLFNDDKTVTAWRVGVNGVHPYSGSPLDWDDIDYKSYVINSTNKRVMTLMPRPITVGPSDTMTAVMLSSKTMVLSPSTYNYSLPSNLRVRVYSMETGSPVFVAAATVPDMSAVNLAAFGWGFGPANLAPFMTVPSRYRAYLSNTNENILSEYIEVIVDPDCKEGSRQFGWLNKLGGIDQYRFVGRETYIASVKRATVKRQYSGGDFDYRERMYRALPKRLRRVSTGPVNDDTRQWLAEDLFESPTVNVKVTDRWNTAIIESDEAESRSTRVSHRPFTMEYRTGADDLSQNA
jgi:hypothetical protein